VSHLHHNLRAALALNRDATAYSGNSRTCLRRSDRRRADTLEAPRGGTALRHDLVDRHVADSAGATSAAVPRGHHACSPTQRSLFDLPSPPFPCIHYLQTTPMYKNPPSNSSWRDHIDFQCHSFSSLFSRDLRSARLQGRIRSRGTAVHDATPRQQPGLVPLSRSRMDPLSLSVPCLFSFAFNFPIIPTHLS
jgi:hypothetical protein